jgi:pyruvate formate lyase activating enzyme
MNVKIKGFIPTSLIDYPGKISSVVFFAGCNFRCPFCYNTEIVEDSDALETITPEKIFAHLKSQRKWIDGVVLGGGEPTLHAELPEFLTEIKKLGFLVKLDTNGTTPAMLEELIKKKLVDYIAMDIKAPLEKYEKTVNARADTNNIRKSVDLIIKSGIDYEFRTTVVPKLFSKEDALAIGRWLKGSKRYYIQQFRSEKTLDKTFQNEKAYTPDDLKGMVKEIKPLFEICELRGV